MTDRPTVLLIHGAWHGSWAWDRLIPLLDKRGVDALAVDLPSVGEGGDLAADVEVVTRALDGLSAAARPVTVVAHSYGGMVATEATAGRSDIGHIVYVAAFQLDEGDALTSALTDGLPPWLSLDEAAGALSVVDPVTWFYGGVDPDLAAEAAGRLRPQALKSFMDPLTAAGWKGVPCTYIACTEDQAIPYPLQEAMASRSAAVVTMPSAHSPFLSHAEEVADVVAAAAASSL